MVLDRADRLASVRQHTQWLFSFDRDDESVPKCVAAQRGQRICAIVTTRNQTGSKSMDSNTQVLQRVFVKFPMESSDNASPIDVRVGDDDVVRSENNILQWMSYLPEDCIKAMIAMGWDVTT